jgi:hypothetical protein
MEREMDKYQSKETLSTLLKMEKELKRSFENMSGWGASADTKKAMADTAHSYCEVIDRIEKLSRRQPS